MAYLYLRSFERAVNRAVDPRERSAAARFCHGLVDDVPRSGLQNLEWPTLGSLIREALHDRTGVPPA